MNVVHLGFTDLAIAAGLVLASAAASLALQLRLHRPLLWAAARMTVQLLMVGLVLRLVFRAGSAPATLLIVLLMIGAAAREVAVRPAERLRGWANFRIGALVVGASSIATVCLALFTAIQPSPWYDPRYAIPLMGIVLGTVLNSASLALDSFYGGLAAGRAAIEARLALGATTREAFAPFVRDAIRRGLIPLINQMSAAGIITLPGIMTGQLLAGMDPLESVKYQIMLLFLLTGAGAMAGAGAVYLAAAAVTDERQRLRLDRLRGR
ncbi:iron export ABC transporter permease subunit FetB [Rhodoferax koreense]|uniref:Iron export ABC transporter permease subunit FetB n=1 Tax=Rhodoferax koreensis TaxID=1842727 RepID=A0A1P8JUT7_9BURK|nr:iron export ABC transporter permease subunit FetB [Rhodoferax koreense]APW37536.1 iron export ABC transporter permease subunit FetB [Rhodoferax koreense]